MDRKQQAVRMENSIFLGAGTPLLVACERLQSELPRVGWEGGIRPQDKLQPPHLFSRMLENKAPNKQSSKGRQRSRVSK